jgi:hypothetical protein
VGKVFVYFISNRLLFRQRWIKLICYERIICYKFHNRLIPKTINSSHKTHRVFSVRFWRCFNIIFEILRVRCEIAVSCLHYLRIWFFSLTWSVPVVCFMNLWFVLFIKCCSFYFSLLVTFFLYVPFSFHPLFHRVDFLPRRTNLRAISPFFKACWNF